MPTHINIKFMKDKHQEGEEPMFTQPKSNNALIGEYINFGSPMNQILLIEAMGKYCKYVVEHEAQIIESFANSPIHGPAWVQAARDWRDLLNKNGRINH